MSRPLTAIEEAFCRLPAKVTSTRLGTVIFKSLERSLERAASGPRRGPHRPRPRKAN